MPVYLKALLARTAVFSLMAVLLVVVVQAVYAQTPPTPVLWSPVNGNNAVDLPPRVAWCPVKVNGTSVCSSSVSNDLNVDYLIYFCEGVGCSDLKHVGTVSSGACLSNVCVFDYQSGQPNVTYGWQVVAMHSETGTTSLPSSRWYFTTQDSPSLIVTSDPTVQNIEQGQTASYTITATGINGVNSGTISFQQIGCPSGASCSITPVSCTFASVDDNCKVTFSVTNTLNVNGGTYSMRITGNHQGDTLSNYVDVTLNLTEIADLVIAPNGVWPTSANIGDTLTFGYTTTNQGGKNATGFNDALLVNGSEVNRTTGNVLAPGGSLNSSLTWSPTSCGTFNVRVQTDMTNVVVESNESNNTAPISFHQVNVVCPQPDLLVTSASASAPICQNKPVTITATTRNQGGGPAALSITRGILGFGSCEIITSALPAGGQETGTCSLTPTQAGAQTLSVIADSQNDVLNESNEGNNTFSIATTVIGNPPVPATPTFSGISDVALTVNWVDGANETFYQVWRNTVNNFATASNVSGNLAANTTSWSDTGLVPVTTYYYWIVAGNVCASTNSTPGSTTTSATPGPDLVISNISTTAPLCVGQATSVTVTTRNQGTASAGTSNTLVDMAGGGCSISVAALPIGGQSTGACSLTPTTISSTVNAIADSANTISNELNESNNSNSQTVTIQTTPGAITGLNSIASSQTTLSWDWGDVVGVTSYEYRLQGSTTWQSTSVSNVGISALTCGTSYTIEVRAANACGGGAIATNTASTNPCSSLLLTIDPDSLDISQGDTANYTVIANLANGTFADTVNFTLTACPPGGASCVFTPATCNLAAGTSSCSTSLNISNTGSVAEGSYTLTVNASTQTSGLTASAEAVLNVFIPVDVLIGDLNCDNIVDVKDLGIMLSTSWWGIYSGGYAHPACASSGGGGGGGSAPPPSQF